MLLEMPTQKLSSHLPSKQWDWGDVGDKNTDLWGSMRDLVSGRIVQLVSPPLLLPGQSRVVECLCSPRALGAEGRDGEGRGRKRKFWQIYLPHKIKKNFQLFWQVNILATWISALCIKNPYNINLSTLYQQIFVFGVAVKGILQWLLLHWGHLSASTINTTFNETEQRFISG